MYRFDDKLAKAFTEAATAGIAIQPATALKLETLLSALSRLFPNEIHPYVEDQETFLSMCAEAWPTPDQVTVQTQLAAVHSSEASEPGTSPGFHIQLDPELERILLLETNVSRTSRSFALSIRELMKLISRDAQTASHLKKRWGVVIRTEP